MDRHVTYALLAVVAVAAFMALSRYNFGHRGAGDTVQVLASAFGIPQLENCGCKHRQNKWNEVIPY